MARDLKRLHEQLNFEYPIIGFYDAPDPSIFEPLVVPESCLFKHFDDWRQGRTVLVTKDQFGCQGCGRWLCGVEGSDSDQLITFLAETEGLRASRELMSSWIDSAQPYVMEHDNILVGPLREDNYEYLKTVTFFVNPDQLSALMNGAIYDASPDDPDPVIIPFGAGCSLLAPMLKDLSIAQALVGATDLAMRKYLPPEILAFTVTVPMFERLCALDERSFLYKSFWKGLSEARMAGSKANPKKENKDD